VDLYNTSSNPVAVSKVTAVGYTPETMASGFIVSKDGSSDLIKPFPIPAGAVQHEVLRVDIPIPKAAFQLMDKCDCDTFEKFKDFMHSIGRDELGNVAGQPQNAGVEVLAETGGGHQFRGYGKWFPGLDIPTYSAKPLP
jgi:hypothetical protein